MSDDVPKQVRVRTSGDNEYRYHAIESAASLYGCNKSDAITYACDDVAQLVEAVEAVLSRDDLTPAQKKEIALEFESRGISINVETNLDVQLG